MTDPLTFSIPGRPTPTARARVLRNGRSYTPTSTTAAQRAVAGAALIAAGGKRPLWPTQSVSVAINACFAYPASTAKKRITPGWTPMPQRPDLDNCAKTILDGCNGILWADDAQVVSLSIRKWRVSDAADEGFHVEVWAE